MTLNFTFVDLARWMEPGMAAMPWLPPPGKTSAMLASQKPEIEGIISQGDRVAVLLRESGVFKSSGQAYSVRGVQWFTFADGKIKKIDEIVASIWKVES